MTNEFIGLLANVALTLSFIVALVFGIVQVRAAGRDRNERFTLETLRAFQSREFVELMQYITTHELPPDYGRFRALPVSEQVLLMQFAQEMESLGILVAERLIDIDLVDRTLGSMVTNAWAKYGPMMRDLRERQPDPFLAEYFQWLAERLDERMRDHPRRPVHEVGRR